MTWLGVILFASYVHAQQATVWARYPAAVEKFFPPDKYKMLDIVEEEKENEASGYLEPQDRDILFHKLKLEDAVAGLDDLDKDMLVMGARFETLASLVKHYPMLSRGQIIQLQVEIKKRAVKQ